MQGLLGMATTQVSSVLWKRDQEEDDYGWGIVAEMKGNELKTYLIMSKHYPEN